MPSHSPEQARLMRAVAHGWRPDRIQGPPVSVAKEFMAADQRKAKKMAHGGIAGGGVHVSSEGLSPGDPEAGMPAPIPPRFPVAVKPAVVPTDTDEAPPREAEKPTKMAGGGRVVADRGDHFHVTDARGSFRVAKHGLDPATHEKIQAMCSGGEVQGYADGGMVDMAHPENLSPEMQQALADAQRQAQNPTAAMTEAGVAPHEPSPNDLVPGTNLTYAQVIDQNVQSSTGAPPPKLRSDDPAATLGPGALNRLNTIPTPAPKPLTTLQPKGGAARPSPTPSGGGAGGIPGMDPRDLAEAKAQETQGFQQKQQALTDEQAATSAAAQQQADLLKQKAVGEADLMKQQVQMAADHKKALTDQMTAYQRAVDEYGRTGIDPNRYWANASTGQKVLAGIGLLFGALGAGHDGVNKSVGIINQAIDRDIDAQKENLAVKGRTAEMRKGILGAMFAQFQDEDQALQATGEAYRKHAATLMDEMAARTQDPIRQAQLRATAAGLVQSRAQERLAMEAGWQAKAAEIAVAKQKVAQGWTKLGLMAGKGAPGGVDTSALDRLEQAALHGGLTEYGSSRDTAALAIATQLNGGKAPRPATVQMIREMLPEKLSGVVDPKRVHRTIDNLRQALRFASPSKGAAGGAEAEEEE